MQSSSMSFQRGNFSLSNGQLPPGFHVNPIGGRQRHQPARLSGRQASGGFLPLDRLTDALVTWRLGGVWRGRWRIRACGRRPNATRRMRGRAPAAHGGRWSTSDASVKTSPLQGPSHSPAVTRHPLSVAKDTADRLSSINTSARTSSAILVVVQPKCRQSFRLYSTSSSRSATTSRSSVLSTD